MENPSHQVNKVCFFIFVFFAALTQESVQQQVHTSTAPLQAHYKLTVLAGATLYIPKGVDVDQADATFERPMTEWLEWGTILKNQSQTLEFDIT